MHFVMLFSRGHATLHLAVSVGRSVGPVTFLNSERFLHYCSCPTVRNWIAVYPALFWKPLKNILTNCKELKKHFVIDIDTFIHSQYMK